MRPGAALGGALVAGTLAGPAAAMALPQSEEATVRLVRSVSGTRGAQRGSQFEVEDPRTVFTVPQDRQVLVYFEWEGGAAGLRHFEGRWKDPSGAVVLVAPADQRTSGRRFGMYWTLALPETVAPGLWALEASVDGRPAGTHAFEIRGGRAVSALSAAQLYARAKDAAALAEKLGAAGEVASLGVASAVDGDLLAVPFRLVDGATAVRVLLPDGRRADTREVAGWSRRQGWALVRAPAHGVTVLPRGRASGVGETVFVVEARDDGSRAIGQSAVVGESADKGGLLLADAVPSGSPILNGAGEQVGIVAGGEDEPLGEVPAMLLSRPTLPRGLQLLGLDRVSPAPGRAATTLAEMGAQGHFMRALSPERRHVISGVFAGRVQRGGAVPMPMDQRTSFSRREGQVYVFVQWNPQDKRDSTSAFEIYDADNKMIARSDAAALKLKPKQLLFSTWMFRTDRLPAGDYRVDLLLGAEPVWRGWVRLTD